MAARTLDHLELLTIAEKDEQYFKTWMGEDIQEITRRVLGVRRWIQYKSAITFLSRFGYFAITRLRSKITLGEEFCEARLSNNKGILVNLLTVLLNNDDLRLPPEIPKFYSSILKDIHLVTFFLCSDFYELSKRVTNHSYVTFDTNSYQSKKIDYLYRFIGLISLAKLILRLGKQQDNFNDQSSKSLENDRTLSGEKDCQGSISSEEKKKITQDPTMRCHLCSETRVEPTSTLCGHIFCWNCIHQWLKERAECPICRAPTEPSRLIHLINFR